MWASPTMQQAFDAGCTLMHAQGPWSRMTGHFVLSMTTHLERGPNPRPFSIDEGVTEIPEDLWSDWCAEHSPSPRDVIERAWIESFRRMESGQGTARTQDILAQMRFLSYMIVGHPMHLRAPTDSEGSIRKYVGELNDVLWEHFLRLHHPKQLIPR